jgi:quinol monooxygenase YgiN
MAVTYTIVFRVRAAELDRFHMLLGGVLDAMRAEAGFISATLHADPQDPHRFLLHETWRDHHEVVEVEIKRAYRDALHATLPDLLEVPREIGMWTPLREDRRG